MRDTKRSNRIRLAAVMAFAGVLATRAALAGAPPPFEARAGLDLVTAAAQVWAQDAVLTYIENDEPVDSTGTAERWGYLFYSERLDQSRSYSVRDGKIVVARNLDMRFEAPPLAAGWIDSHAALAIADENVGAAFCKKNGGRLSTMLLMRGAFQDENPDQTTWTVIYTSPHAPALFVMVDATAGKVRRTWRG